MNPAFFSWIISRTAPSYGHARRGACGPAQCGPTTEEQGYSGHGFGGDGDDGALAFGVRRPLRFLAYKLELTEPQVAKLAVILNDLKTERAQAAVDHRRSTAAYADALSGEKLDEARLQEAGAQRLRTAEQLRDAVQRALGRIHTLLEPRQREHLAYLIRTGAISL